VQWPLSRWRRSGAEIRSAAALCIELSGLLQPGHIEHKYYCPFTGLVHVEELKEKTVQADLVAIDVP
jgi:hypothetical protein